MSQLPLVSIVAINYNNSKYLVQTLDSIAAQTYPNFELLVIDDCSTDNSVALIEQWLVKYSGQYQFIKHDVNKGVCAACNSGLRNAVGTFFSLIATDDVMLPDKTAKQVALLSASGERVAGVYSDARLMDESGQPMEGNFIQRHCSFDVMPSGNIYNVLLRKNFIPAMTVMLKKEILDELGGYDETLVYEDYDMWLRVARQYDLLYSDFVSCVYRVRPGSLTFSIKNWGYSNARIFLKHLGAPLPTQWIADTAWRAYTDGGSDTMPLMWQLAKGTGDRVLVAICFLWKFTMPLSLGEQVITEIKAQIGNGLSSVITGVSDETYFSEALSCLPFDLFFTLLSEKYFEGTKDIYKVGINCLLRRFRVPHADAERIMSSRNWADITPALSGQRINVDFFADVILPAIPADALREVVSEVNAEGSNMMIELLYEAALRSRNEYLSAAYVLWKCYVPRSVFDGIMASCYGSQVRVAFSTAVDSIPAAANVFVKNVVPHIPVTYYEEIASTAFLNDSRFMLAAVRMFARKTRSKYLKAMHLLWKYNIDAFTARIILDRVTGYMRDGKSRFYIDLCIYKDIFGAIRSGKVHSHGQ